MCSRSAGASASAQKCQLPLRLRRDRRGEELIGILAHLDTVPAGEGWSCSPFAGTLADGQLYGRGVEDDKGPAIACVYAMRGLLTINAGQLAVEGGRGARLFRHPLSCDRLGRDGARADAGGRRALRAARVEAPRDAPGLYGQKQSRHPEPACGIPRTDRRHGRTARGGRRHLCPRDEEHRGLWPRPPGKGVHRARGRRASAGGGAAASARNLPRRPFWTYAVSEG